MIESRRRGSISQNPAKEKSNSAELSCLRRSVSSISITDVYAIRESTQALGETTTAIAFDHTLTYAYATYAYINLTIFSFGIQIEQCQRVQQLQYSRFLPVILFMKQSSMKKHMVESVEETKAGAKVQTPVNPAADVLVDRAVDPVDSSKVDLEPASLPLSIPIAA